VCVRVCVCVCVCDSTCTGVRAIPSHVHELYLTKLSKLNSTSTGLRAIPSHVSNLVTSFIIELTVEQLLSPVGFGYGGDYSVADPNPWTRSYIGYCSPPCSLSTS
jgi:hypothetical protein